MGLKYRNSGFDFNDGVPMTPGEQVQVVSVPMYLNVSIYSGGVSAKTLAIILLNWSASTVKGEGEGDYIRLMIPSARDLRLLDQFPNLALFFATQLGLCRRGIFIHPRSRPSPRDRNDIGSLCKQPRDGDLTGGTVVHLSHFFQSVHKLQDFRKVLLCVLGEETTKVIFGEVGG